MNQVARNRTGGLDGFLKGGQYLIHDRSSLFTSDFSPVLESVGIESVRLLARAPNLKAVAKRFGRTIKDGGLNRLVLIGEASAPRAID
jgi:hypothetical protein